MDHKLPGKIGVEMMWKDPISGVKLGEGRKPPTPSRHSRRILAIGDEACALSGELIDALGNIDERHLSARADRQPDGAREVLGIHVKKEMKNWSRMTISVLNLAQLHG